MNGELRQEGGEGGREGGQSEKRGAAGWMSAQTDANNDDRMVAKREREGGGGWGYSACWQR